MDTQTKNKMSVCAPNCVGHENNFRSEENNFAPQENNPAENNPARQIKSNREISNDSNVIQCNTQTKTLIASNNEAINPAQNASNNPATFNRETFHESFHDITAPHLMSSSSMLNHQHKLINHQITISHYVSKHDTWFYCMHHRRMCYYVCVLCLMERT